MSEESQKEAARVIAEQIDTHVKFHVAALDGRVAEQLAGLSQRVDDLRRDLSALRESLGEPPP